MKIMQPRRNGINRIAVYNYRRPMIISKTELKMKSCRRGE